MYSARKQMEVTQFTVRRCVNERLREDRHPSSKRRWGNGPRSVFRQAALATALFGLKRGGDPSAVARARSAPETRPVRTTTLHSRTVDGSLPQIEGCAQVRHQALRQGVATSTIIQGDGGHVDTPDGVCVIDSPSPLATTEQKAVANDCAFRGGHGLRSREFAHRA